ncbi:DUF1146 family protein [Fructilactobacillus myrtifloralis]|uniref:DUF1146 family protein n=1 Tax=Fructilactobacillus myrtifloralis TaxID=2940301 RepID=A0ABY5BNT7_9LACO|nr:DUF1146 family protein [Fructilactobacillus myrtifloralis]USS85144.1 DUF1146 family protein [Fructilactobacillus myrtifloralis]
MNGFGLQALISIISQLFFVILAFWAIQGIHFERFVPIKEQQGKVLLVLLALGLGSLSSNFFLSFIDNLKNLQFLF